MLYKEAESRCVVPGVAVGRAVAGSLKEPAGIRAKVTPDCSRNIESLRRCRLAVRKHRIRLVGRPLQKTLVMAGFVSLVLHARQDK